MSLRAVILSASLLVMAAEACADAKEAARVFTSIISGAKAKRTDYDALKKMYASTLTVEDHESIARNLLLDPLSYDQIGDAGVAWKENALVISLYKLSELPSGDAALLRLLDDKKIVWNDNTSLTLCDAIVRRRRDMLPGLRKATNKEPANQCAAHIRAGHKTAF
ncbi:MAG TPA: hypothetical protein VK629_15060 [Steroidobacteraceae bacterium]|nr:hypothetical protein [Steroidobacteraceae bacterium]